MLRILIPVSALCLVAACAPDLPAEPDLPLPPPPPPRIQPSRAAPRPVVPTPDDAARADDAAARTDDDAPAAPVWRVARDGVVGCADPASLAVLGRATESTPRRLAEARAEGGCRTTFRVNEWASEGADGDLVRLRLTNGAPLTLWFRRSEVVAP